MSDNTQNPLLKALVALVILLIAAVGIQAWYLLDIKQQLSSETAQQNMTARQKKQDAIAEAAISRAEKREAEPRETNENKQQRPSAADSPAVDNKLTGNADDKAPEPASSNNPAASRPAANHHEQSNPYYPPRSDQRPWPRPQHRQPQWPPAPDYRPPHWPDPYTDNLFSSPYDAQTWDPYAEIQRMQREMDRLFNESFRRFDNSPEFQHLFREGMISPELDVREDDDKYTIQVNLPGSDESSVDVKLDGQQLTIQGKQNYQQQNRDAQGNIIFRERRSGSFKRSFTLPEPVDEKGMKTDINKGVLTIIIPKLKDPV